MFVHLVAFLGYIHVCMFVSIPHLHSRLYICEHSSAIFSLNQDSNLSPFGPKATVLTTGPNSLSQRRMGGRDGRGVVVVVYSLTQDSNLSPFSLEATVLTSQPVCCLWWGQTCMFTLWLHMAGPLLWHMITGDLFRVLSSRPDMKYKVKNYDMVHAVFIYFYFILEKLFLQKLNPIITKSKHFQGLNN